MNRKDRVLCVFGMTEKDNKRYLWFYK